MLDETVIFVYSGGKLVEEFSTKAPSTNPKTKYVATDHLQSIRALSNQDGEIVSRRDFLPFGEELQADANLRKSDFKYSETEDDVRQKFTGYEKDKETGLDFAQARMYQNQHARFTAVDPLLASGKSGNPQTFNRYVYVMNSPLIFSDPDGLQTTSNPYNVTCDIGQPGCGPVKLGTVTTEMDDPNNMPFIEAGYTILGTINSNQPIYDTQQDYSFSGQAMRDYKYDWRRGIRNGAQTFVDYTLNALPNSDVTGQFYPFPTNFTFGVNPMNSGYSMSDIGLAPRFNFEKPKNLTFGQAVASGATQTYLTGFFSSLGGSTGGRLGVGRFSSSPKMGRVGRWMDEIEFKKIIDTDMVQESSTGTTHVVYPANPNGFMSQAKYKQVYVEFDVPVSSIKMTNTKLNWAKILSPGTVEGRNAAMRGRIVPQLPPALNIDCTMCRTRFP